MKFTKQDLIQISNLMRLTKQGTFTLNGMDALAFADCVRWLAGLHEVAIQQIQKEETKDKEPEKPKMQIKEVITPIKKHPKVKAEKVKTAEG